MIKKTTYLSSSKSFHKFRISVGRRMPNNVKKIIPGIKLVKISKILKTLKKSLINSPSSSIL
jgi:hypothetical protein